MQSQHCNERLIRFQIRQKHVFLKTILFWDILGKRGAAVETITSTKKLFEKPPKKTEVTENPRKNV